MFGTAFLHRAFSLIEIDYESNKCYQEILHNGEDMEVLEPLWLRKEIARKIEKMWDKYKS